MSIMEQDGKTGITWNNTTGSDSQYTTDNRFDFNFTTSSSNSLVTKFRYNNGLFGLMEESDSSNYTRSGTSLTGVTDKSGTYTITLVVM